MRLDIPNRRWQAHEEAVQKLADRLDATHEHIKSLLRNQDHHHEHIVTFQAELENIMATLAELTAAVAAQHTVVQSVITLLGGIREALDKAIEDDDPEAIQAVADQIKADTTALSDAVVANTPVTPAPPVEEPKPEPEPVDPDEPHPDNTLPGDLPEKS